MKRFEHTWSNDFFLLHIQLNNEENLEFDTTILREYWGGKEKQEVINVKGGSKSHRFIVSRTHPKEEKVTIEYPDGIILEAYKIDDRAYYPTESFYVG